MIMKSAWGSWPRCTVFFLLAGVFTSLLAPALAIADSEPQVFTDQPGFFRVIDQFGRERVVKRPIRRAIVLGGAASETVWALGCGDRIVGRSEWTNWPPAMAQVPSIGSVAHPNLELIWHLRPDLIISDAHFFRMTQRMEALGAPVLFISGYVQPQIRGMIRALGQIFEQPQRATQLVAFLDDLDRLLAQRVGWIPRSRRPRVFLGNGRELYFTSNAKSGRRLVHLAGGVNIADELPFPYQRVSPEWIVDQAPDHIVLGANLGGIGFKVPGAAHMSALRKEAMSRPGLRALQCVAQGKVYLINQRIGYGLRSLVGALHLAKAFHPSKMQGVDPRAIHQHMLARFWGLDMDGTYFVP